MERVITAPPSHGSTACTACAQPVEGARCGHCGAASRIRNYRVLRQLAVSPHSRVYLAEDEQGAKLAVKELVYSMVPSAEELEAFDREARLLQQLSHDRIPRFVAAFTEGTGIGTRLYLAQAFVAGESLEQKLAHHRFTEAEALGIARQVLEVLVWLHALRPAVVHRDLKPANLIAAADGRIHVVDFGTARDVRSAGTHRSTLVGTVGYIAPEQLGGSVSPKSDLFALGASLVHLLTGQPPEHLAGAGMELDLARVDVSERTRAFLSRLVAARPDARFASAAEALAALDDPGRIARMAPSRRAPWAALTAGALGLAALLAGAAFFVVRTAPPAVSVATVTAPKPVPVEAPRAAQPRMPLSAFKWQLANWDFRKPGPWLLDMTGRGHSVQYPPSGYEIDFFGPVWDGSTGMLVPDAPELGPDTRFNISFDYGLTDEQKKAPVDDVRIGHLITRGDPNGRFAYDVAMVGDRVRFTIMNEAGETSEIEGPAKLEGVFTHFYAQFDPTTGEQTLYRLGECKPFARAVTKIRPARTVPGGQVHLVDGLIGRVGEIQLDRGLNVPSKGKTEKSCGMSGEHLDG